MKTSLALVTFLLLLHGKGCAAPVVYPEYGFKIDTLVASKETQTANFTPLLLCLPISNGFSPNVNVLIQPYKTNPKEYLTTSVKQFESMGWLVITSSSDATSAVIEATATMNQIDVHFYVRAIVLKDKVVLATASCAETDWPKLKEKLVGCVNSLQPAEAK